MTTKNITAGMRFFDSHGGIWEAAETKDFGVVPGVVHFGPTMVAREVSLQEARVYPTRNENAYSCAHDEGRVRLVGEWNILLDPLEAALEDLLGREVTGDEWERVYDAAIETIDP